MAESTASSVTKNRIKTNYHGALEGFASYYFDVFPTETGPTSPTGEDDIRLKLLTKSNAFQRYFEIVDKKIFVEHLADIDIDNNIVYFKMNENNGNRVYDLSINNILGFVNVNDLGRGLAVWVAVADSFTKYIKTEFNGYERIEQFR